MDFFDHPHYRTTKIVTCLIGMWPYQAQYKNRIFNFITIFLFATQVFAQVMSLIVYSDDVEMIVELITPCMIDLVVATKYLNTVINMKTMVKLLDRLKVNQTICTREEEKRILDDHAYIGKLLVYGYITAVYMTTIVFITEPLIPQWINFVLQLNKTIPKKYPVAIYWFGVDMEDNFHSILCYEAICIMVLITITVANDSLFIVFLQHACALFAIVGHQLKNLPDGQKKDWNYSRKLTEVSGIQYEHYIMCIKNHKRAIEFSDLLEQMYVWSFGMVIAINMPIMSLTAVQLVSLANSIQEIIKYSMFACIQILHLFFDCYLSQKLSDYSIAIQKHITFSTWYEMPLRTQKLVTLVILRSQIPCRLTAGKIVILSMVTFAAIVKMSASYFTVFLSMR